MHPHGCGDDWIGVRILKRKEYPLAKGLNGRLLFSLPDFNGMVPDPLARAHSDRAAISNRISVEDQSRRAGLTLVLPG
jgi:hypothetical protein